MNAPAAITIKASAARMNVGSTPSLAFCVSAVAAGCASSEGTGVFCVKGALVGAGVACSVAVNAVKRSSMFSSRVLSIVIFAVNFSCGLRFACHSAITLPE